MHLLTQTAGNGVATTLTFDANTGRLTNVRAGTSNNVAQWDYYWDPLGNLTERADGYQGTFEYFCYDPLNRLTANAIGNTATSCTSSGSGITTKTAAYDAIGNITSRSDVGTYSYPASGSSSVRPHAVSSISGTVMGTTNPNYSYDGNGNLTCEYAGSSCTSPARSVTWTSFNMADTVTQGTTTSSFAYDDTHQRVTQAVTVSGSTTTTTYLNDPMSGAMSETAVTGSTTTWHDFIAADGGIVAQRNTVSGTTTLQYFALDHLGSVSAVTDSSGTVLQRLSYDPWGKRRNANGTDDATCSITSTTTRGFTNQENIDPLCAINLNARIYDPTIGRFMSADTIVQNPFSSQSYNRYSYIENGPLSGADPTGHCNETASTSDAPGKQKCNAATYDDNCRCWRDNQGHDLSSIESGGTIMEDQAWTVSKFDKNGNLISQQTYFSGGSLNEALGSTVQTNTAAGITTNLFVFTPGLVGFVSFGPGPGADSTGDTGSVPAAFTPGTPGTVTASDPIYKFLQAIFLNAPLTGSALKTDPYHLIANQLRSAAVESGDYFATPSGSFPGFSLLLQDQVSVPGYGAGIVEYLYSFQSLSITHQVYIPGAPVSGYPNNWRGQYPAFGSGTI